jgi:glycerol-3-phosphate acyltransferase PlsY
MLTNILLLVLAYLLGSLPTGYLAGKWLKGIDIRTVGSGSTGATNVLRTLGKPAGIIVFAIDVLKGVAAILLARTFASAALQDWIVVLAGLLGVIGHSKPIWLGFKGGKSVAIGLGIILAIDWRVGLSAFGIFLASILVTRIVSISSIAAAVGVLVLMYIFQPGLPYMLFAAIASTYVIVRHRTNIQRILAGTEPKIGQKLPQEPQP